MMTPTRRQDYVPALGGECVLASRPTHDRYVTLLYPPSLCQYYRSNGGNSIVEKEFLLQNFIYDLFFHPI